MPYTEHDQKTHDLVDLHERMKSVEVVVDKMDKNIEKIMDNHLPHLQVAIDLVNTNFRKEIDEIVKRLEKIEINWAKLIGGAAAVLFLVNIFTQYLDRFIK